MTVAKNHELNQNELFKIPSGLSEIAFRGEGRQNDGILQDMKARTLKVRMKQSNLDVGDKTNSEIGCDKNYARF